MGRHPPRHSVRRHVDRETRFYQRLHLHCGEGMVVDREGLGHPHQDRVLLSGQQGVAVRVPSVTLITVIGGAKSGHREPCPCRCGRQGDPKRSAVSHCFHQAVHLTSGCHGSRVGGACALPYLADGGNNRYSLCDFILGIAISSDRLTVIAQRELFIGSCAPTKKAGARFTTQMRRGRTKI